MGLEWLAVVFAIITVTGIIAAFIHKSQTSNENKESANENKEAHNEILDTIKELENELLKIKSGIIINLKTLQLNDFEKSELGMPMFKNETELAKQRQVTRTDLISHSNDAKGAAGERTAKQIGVSTSTFERAKKIIEEAPEEIKQKLRDGTTSISKEYQNLIKKQKKKQKLNDS